MLPPQIADELRGVPPGPDAHPETVWRRDWAQVALLHKVQDFPDSLGNRKPNSQRSRIIVGRMLTTGSHGRSVGASFLSRQNSHSMRCWYLTEI
jgi:hypothetical protein